MNVKTNRVRCASQETMKTYCWTRPTATNSWSQQSTSSSWSTIIPREAGVHYCALMYVCVCIYASRSGGQSIGDTYSPVFLQSRQIQRVDVAILHLRAGDVHCMVYIFARHVASRQVLDISCNVVELAGDGKNKK